MFDCIFSALCLSLRLLTGFFTRSAQLGDTANKGKAEMCTHACAWMSGFCLGPGVAAVISGMFRIEQETFYIPHQTSEINSASSLIYKKNVCMLDQMIEL